MMRFILSVRLALKKNILEKQSIRMIKGSRVRVKRTTRVSAYAKKKLAKNSAAVQI